ncbi:MAG: selenocysteine-specific translation elongation factor [Planctomycetes bacterium]|nr:selenocysteine-specific translation elongation factor [Planctomycetota bacterium]
MAIDLILGTAGHIDHGKTSLIRALTGTDPDRLPEEKRRGITIDIGFAHLDLGAYRLGIVDVPGHERFVRNMLAGATGMDLAMLVVAADDSIKPQTLEHLEILRLLKLPAGVIVLTKSDMVDAEWLDLVESEIRELVAGTFLESAPIVRTSIVRNSGFDELKSALRVAAERAAVARGQTDSNNPFRMAIDRVFTLAGHGTVVTGSVSSGSCATGDELHLEPGSIPVRVRGIENHDHSVERVVRGQRAAINLVGVHHEQVHRGHELATPGHLRSSRVLTVQFTLLPTAAHPLKSRQRVRLHVGTAEILASVMLLDRDRLEPGELGSLQLFLLQGAATTWGQPFVLRSESPVITIGGGRVLDPDAERLRRPDADTLEQVRSLSSDEPLVRAGAALFLAGFRDWRPDDWQRSAGITATAPVYDALKGRGDVIEIPLSPTRNWRGHRLVLDRLCDRIAAALETLHRQNPLRMTLDRSRVGSGFAYLPDPALFDAALERMRRAGRLRIVPNGITLAGQGPKLSANEQKLLTQIVDQYRAAGVEPPTVKELQAQTVKNQNAVPQLVSLAADDGQLVKINNDFYLHADVDREIREKLRPQLADQGLTVSQIRELLGTSRKYALPLCEHFDKVGFTRRLGDVRYLGS